MRIVFQHADYTEEDVEADDPMQYFENINWEKAISLYNEFKADDLDCCPPGIYFYDKDKKIGFSTKNGHKFHEISNEDEGSFSKEHCKKKFHQLFEGEKEYDTSKNENPSKKFIYTFWFCITLLLVYILFVVIRYFQK